LLVEPLGSYSNHHYCPIALFQPSDEFVLSGKVTSPIIEQWDAAQLIVWADTANWAKLYLEKTHYMKPIVGSFVTNGLSEDYNSAIPDRTDIYLQLAKVGKAIFFYYSENGNDWIFVQAFHFKPSNIMIGFSCESTFNENGNKATFSEIKYEERKLNDILKGFSLTRKYF